MSNQTDPLADVILNQNHPIYSLDNRIAQQLERLIPNDELDFWADECSPADEYRGRGDGWASIRADINLTKLATALASEVAAAVRAAFPAEYRIEWTNQYGNAEVIENLSEESAISSAKYLREAQHRDRLPVDVKVMSRPVIPWQEIKESDNA